MDDIRNRIDILLLRYLGDSVDIFGVTFFGWNAMSWGVQWEDDLFYWYWQPPCIKCNWQFTWGCFYKSPNASPSHSRAIIYYGR